MRVDMDTCEEILVTITRNKTRSLLTAFGVFWGIFMLVALMGGGQGMQEMMQAEFEGFATNSGFMPHKRQERLTRDSAKDAIGILKTQILNESAKK